MIDLREEAVRAANSIADGMKARLERKALAAAVAARLAFRDIEECSDAVLRQSMTNRAMELDGLADDALDELIAQEEKQE